MYAVILTKIKIRIIYIYIYIVMAEVVEDVESTHTVDTAFEHPTVIGKKLDPVLLHGYLHELHSATVKLDTGE